jgi:heptosyltransferase II
MSTPPRPLIVRLRNWVGDVTLALPMLARLHDGGYALQLIGKGWARDLLAGHGWPVHALPATLRERVRQLRGLRAQARRDDPGFDGRLNAMALPYSFSSALEMRLAGLRAIGHAYEGRSFLLARAVGRPQQRHELESYWQLGSALLGAEAPLPTHLNLRPSPPQQAQAQALLKAHGVADDFIVICPFAGGTFEGQDKTWPDFAAFAAQELAALGPRLVICPGPGEEAVAQRDFAGATLLAGVQLGTYAALLQRAALMISNDTGPGHMAAAVGTPLLSVLGPSDPAQWRAWGPSVHIVQGERGWPSRHEVLAAAQQMLHSGRQRT